MSFNIDIARKITELRNSLVSLKIRESAIYRLWQNLKAKAEKEYMPNILLGLWPVMRENFAKLANEQGSKLAFVKKKIEEIQAEIERLLRLPDDPTESDPAPEEDEFDPTESDPAPEEDEFDPTEPDPEPEEDEFDPTEPDPEPENDPEAGNSNIQGKATF